MQGSSRTRGITLGQRAGYQIVIQGVLSEESAERVGGLVLQNERGPHGGATTTLSASISDQAQLIGLLNALYELRLPILSVEMIRVE